MNIVKKQAARRVWFPSGELGRRTSPSPGLLAVGNALRFAPRNGRWRGGRWETLIASLCENLVGKKQFPLVARQDFFFFLEALDCCGLTLLTSKILILCLKWMFSNAVCVGLFQEGRGGKKKRWHAACQNYWEELLSLTWLSHLPGLFFF